MDDILKVKLGYCEFCKRYFVYPQKRRLDTYYVDEQRNWLTSCKLCFDIKSCKIQEQWDEYYKDIEEQIKDEL